jgi:hypothetical protein
MSLAFGGDVAVDMVRRWTKNRKDEEYDGYREGFATRMSCAVVTTWRISEECGHTTNRLFGSYHNWTTTNIEFR